MPQPNVNSSCTDEEYQHSLSSPFGRLGDTLDAALAAQHTLGGILLSRNEDLKRQNNSLQQELQEERKRRMVAEQRVAELESQQEPLQGIAAERQQQLFDIDQYLIGKLSMLEDGNMIVRITGYLELKNFLDIPNVSQAVKNRIEFLLKSSGMTPAQVNIGTLAGTLMGQAQITMKDNEKKVLK